MGSAGLRIFQDLKESYKVSTNTFFLYLQLRSAIQAADIPNDQKSSAHPVMSLIKKLLLLPKGHVSLMFNTLLRTPFLCQNGTKSVLSHP